MADIITTLHRKDNPSDNVYPNVKDENIPDTIQRKLTAGENVAISDDNTISSSFDDSMLVKQIGGVYQLNYLDNNNLVSGYYEGQNPTPQSFSSWYSTTDYLSAPPSGTILYYYNYNGTTYSRGQWRMVQYDSNKNYISNTFINGTSASAGTGITIGENTAFIRFSVLCTISTAIYYIMISGNSTLPTSFSSFGTYNSLQSQIYQLQNSVTSPLSNMPLLTCGDSITQGATITPVDGVRHAYGYWISQWYNMTLENQGVGGATIAQSSTTTQYHFIEHYKDILSNYSGQEFYLTLFYGENDSVAINNGYETIGEFDTSYDGTTELVLTSFIGAYQTILWYILNTAGFEQCHLLVILPRSNRQDMLTILTQMLTAYQIKFYDFYSFNQPGFFGFASEKSAHMELFYAPATATQYISINSTINSRYLTLYLNDGTHPSEYGQKVLARRLIPYLLEC